MPLREATAEDRAQLIELMLEEERAWFGTPDVSADEAGQFLDHHRLGVIFERAGEAAGYAAVGEGAATMLVADPADPEPALEALVPWLAERGQSSVETYAGDTGRIAWLEAHGFTYSRSSFDLARHLDPPPPPPSWPSGAEVAFYERGQDDAAVHLMIYVDAGWGAVPGHADRSLEAWQSLLTPEQRCWVARRGDRPVGWALGRVFSDGRGWIQQLAVARSDRGLGLGRSLLLHSLADLRAHGASSFALGVQADNENALRLYRDIGFQVTREWRMYQAASG
jgi:ribosomal protein S18 acetylase RimI-like enzyme